MTETRIVELCLAENVAEAHAMLARLAEAGVSASIVGEFIGNAAGIPDLGEQVAPRVWVKAEDLGRSRDVLEQWVCKREHQACDDAPGDEGDAPEEPSAGPSCNMTRRLIQIGCWLGCGVACTGCSVGFVLMLYLSLHAAASGNHVREVVESAFIAVVCGASAVLTGLALKKNLSNLREWERRTEDKNRGDARWRTHRSPQQPNRP